MKKLLVISIMFLYLLAMSGVMIHAHYCGGTLESWNVYLKADGCDDSDCDDEESEPDGCCKDKLIASKVSQDQNHVDAFKLKLSPLIFESLLPVYVIIPSENSYSAYLHSVTNQPNAPPGLWEDIPLYKLHSGFIYYG